MPSCHLILCHPLRLLPTMPPSIRVCSNESTLRMRWPKYWRFNFSIIPSKEIPGLISFRKDWLDLLAVQGTLKSLLQHHSSNASILRRSAFFTVQLSHPYMTTGKTIALTRRTFVGKVDMCIYLPPLLSVPSPHLAPLGHHRLGSLCYLAASCYFTHDSVYLSRLLSQFVPPSPSPAVSTSTFSARFIKTIFLDSIYMC